MSSLPYELVALDLDLTLLDAQHHISPRNLHAVTCCREMGVKVVITSGRMYYTTLTYQHALGLDTPVIAYNGAFIKQESTGKVLFRECLDTAVAREVIDFCAREGLQLNYYLDDTLYSARVTKWSELYSSRTGAVVVPVGDLHTLADRAPTKVLIVAEPELIAQLYGAMRERFAGRAYVTISNVEYLEFMPPSVDKGTALAVVANYYDIAREKVIAFGDAGNDIPAIAWAGLGIAMENAAPEARAVAKRIAPPYDADGVAVVLEEIFGFTPAHV